MSKNYWQIKKQAEQLPSGGGPISRLGGYERTWRTRCYSDGIPDDVPASLVWSGRVPSWRAVAICILRNDLRFRGLGFQDRSGPWAAAFLEELRR